jgi:hypothetical protein
MLRSDAYFGWNATFHWPDPTRRTPWRGSERRYWNVRYRDLSPRPETTAMGAELPGRFWPRLAEERTRFAGGERGVGERVERSMMHLD